MHSGRAVAATLLLCLTALAVAPQAEGAPAEYGAPQYATRGPIRITSALDFTSANGVRGGLGTSISPFIISDWSITSAGNPSNSCAVCISPVNGLYYVLRNIEVRQYDGGQWLTGILIDGANNGAIESTTIRGSATGFELRGALTKFHVKDSYILDAACGFRTAPGMTGVVITNNWFDNQVNNCNPRGQSNDLTFSPTTIEPGTNIAGGNWLGGNYWNDYRGYDTENDRIGNQAHEVQYIHSTSQLLDRYPLLAVPKPVPTASIAMLQQTEFYPPFKVTLKASHVDDSLVTKWLWDFGDGALQETTTDTVQHTYHGNGPFYPRVTIKDTAAAEATSQPIEVKGSNPTQPDVEILPRLFPYQDLCYYPEGNYYATCIRHRAAPTTGEAPFRAQLDFGFRDQVGDKRAAITLDWGDGKVESHAFPAEDVGSASAACSEAKFPVCLPMEHVYRFPGTYVVRVQASNVATLTGIDTQRIVVTNAKPIIDRIVVVDNSGAQHAPDGRKATDPDAPEGVHLKVLATDPDGVITSYEWQIDGEPTPRKGKEITYVEPADRQGASYITVKVTDNLGESTSTTYPAFRLQAEPNNAAPSLTSLTATTAAIDAQTTFTAQATDNDGISVYWWELGDGTVHKTLQPTTKHTYLEPGTYTVRVTAVDNRANPGERLAGQRSLSLTVTGAEARRGNPHDLAINMDPPSGQGDAPLQMQFKAVQGRSPDTATQYVWELGDGSFSYDAELQHTYLKPGAYKVKLTAVDSVGRVSRAEAVVQAGNPVDGLSATIRTSVTQGTVPFQVEFAADVSNPFGEFLTYEWDFGDGQRSNLEFPTHAYTQSGTFQVHLTVTGQLSSANADATIQALSTRPPFALSIDWSPKVAPVPHTLTLQAKTSALTEAPDRYEWTMPDGTKRTTSAVQWPVADYGSFVFKVKATNSATGNSQTADLIVNRQAGDLIVTTQPQGLAETEVRFWYRNYPQAGQSFTWDFGDGTPPATGWYVNHTYAKTGEFDVRLSVRGGGQPDFMDTRRVVVGNSDLSDSIKNAPGPATPILAAAFVAVAILLRRRR